MYGIHACTLVSGNIIPVNRVRVESSLSWTSTVITQCVLQMDNQKMFDLENEGQGY